VERGLGELCSCRGCGAPTMIQEIGFALDSPLEGTRFELAVPPRSGARLARYASRFAAGRARLPLSRQMWNSHQSRPGGSGVQTLGPHDAVPSPVHPGAGLSAAEPFHSQLGRRPVSAYGLRRSTILQGG
jgi:hypothetical protein